MCLKIRFLNPAERASKNYMDARVVSLRPSIVFLYIF